MLNIGDLLDDRYEILSKIGQGGMAYVYRARDTKLDREIAIKMLKEEYSTDDEFIERFKNEARSAARLQQSNIVATYDIVNNGNSHYIVMELVEGVTLKDYIARKEKLGNKETIGIALQVAEGLAEAHRNNIVHRDIKPQNIIISKDGRIKVADFGIAKAVTGEDLNQAVIGSAHYIAPEQAKNGITDARSDLYSLGISMYEMITGRLPYQGENTVNIVMAHIQDALVPPNVYNSEIYPALNDIIIKATKKAPEERYQSAAELIEDIRHAANDPNGHFVKMYDSVGSSEYLNGDDDTDDDIDTAGRGSSDKANDKDEEETIAAIFDDSKVKFTILGITAGILILICVIAGFILTSRKKAGTVGETGIGTEAVKAETEESEMDVTLSIEGEIVMPDLIGMSVEEANAVLAEISMSMDSSTTDYSDEFPEGVIMNQSPAKNEVLTADSQLYVTVSLGSQIQYTLDNLKNMTPEAAENVLTEAGIVVTDETASDFSDEVAESLVMGYRDAGKTGSGAQRVTLVLSRGKQEDYVQMPNLVGLSRAEAARILTENLLAAGRITAVNTDEVNKNYIAGQAAAPGEYIKKGGVVDLEICVGDDGTIPDGTVISEGDILSGIKSSSILSSDYYYGSIDTSCTVGSDGGGPAGGNTVNVGIRLAQRVEGSLEYTVLTEPIPVALGTRIPVSFKNIRGAFGVEEGTVEVYSADSDMIYSSYVIAFGPIG